MKFELSSPTDLDNLLVQKEYSLKQAINIFTEAKINKPFLPALVVSDENYNFFGIMTQKDINAFTVNNPNADLNVIKVEKVYNKNPKYIITTSELEIHEKQNTDPFENLPSNVSFMPLVDRNNKIRSFVYRPKESQEIKYYSCRHLEEFELRFQKKGSKDLTICCEPIGEVPGITHCETAEETLMSFVKERANIITESIKFGMIEGHNDNEERVFTSICAKCTNYKLDNWFGNSKGKINHINFAVYPSPCQCKCIYCFADKTTLKKEQYEERFEKIFDILDLARNKNMLADNVRFSIQSGEITIHPYKDKIFNFIKDDTAIFFTNCFIYDEKIAANLAANTDSIILFSIDAGTSETWKKIKCVDNFSIIKENLAKYSASCVVPWQICLKYIILPGINDNEEDYLSVIEIMKSIKSKTLIISCDSFKKYGREQRIHLIKTAGKLNAMLHMNTMTAIIDDRCYLQDEIQRITAQANSIQKDKQVI